MILVIYFTVTFAHIQRFCIGLVVLETGYWLMARDLMGSGNAGDDVVQVSVPQP